MPKLHFNKTIILLLKVCAAVVVFWVLIKQSQLKVGLFSVAFYKPAWVVTIVSLFYLLVLFGTWRWYRLNLAQGLMLPFSKTLFPTYFGVAFNNVLPGSVGGDFVRLFCMFERFPDSKNKVILSVILDRLTGLIGIFLTVCLIAVWRIKTFGDDRILSYLFWMCLICSVVIFLTFLLPLLFPKEKIDSWFKNKFPNQKWVSSLIAFFDAIRVYKHAKLVIAESLLISIIIQIIMAIIVFVIAYTMNFASISLFDYAIALAAAQIANLIPLTPGGLGVGEMAFASVLMLLNPQSAAGYATIFLAFRFFCSISYFPGVLFYIANFKLPQKQILQ